MVIELRALPHTPVVQALARAFAARGHRLYLVGGAARDLLLGRGNYDLDFTTDARPDAIKQLVRQAGAVDIYTVGEKFGTIGAVFRSTEYQSTGDRAEDDAEGAAQSPLLVEITTFRSEAYQPYSRKPRVEFGQSLAGDLARRDLTINAIAIDVVAVDAVAVDAVADPEGADAALIDPFDGRGDLGRRTIRAVGDPSERFSEDPLRLLRAVRFATQLDFQIEPGTRQALRDQASELSWIPKERIQPELGKILVDPRVGSGLVQLCDLGLMEHLVPELLTLQGMHEDRHRHKDVFEHTLRVVEGTPPDETLRWAALLHDIAKPRTRSVENGEVHFHRHEIVGKQMARRILERLKYPRELTETVGLLVELHLRPNSYEPDWTDGAVRRLMREAGPHLERLLLLSRADVTSRRPERRLAAARRVDELEARCAALQAEADVARLTSPLDGNDLMALFNRGPGPWIRPIKDHLTNLVVDGQLGSDDKEGAAEIARALAKQ